jgi:hypothetical protein
MMGHTANQDQLFYAFNLEEHIPSDHLLRGINQFLDLSTLREHLAPFYSHTDLPPPTSSAQAAVSPPVMVIPPKNQRGEK